MALILVRASVTAEGYCAGWVGYVDDTDPAVQDLLAGGYLSTDVTVLPPPVELCCLPPGGTTNQILAKVSDLDRDANWQNAPPSLPSGPASGVLSGTYPNPIFAEDMATQIELDAAVAGVPEQAQDAVAAMIAAGTQTGLTASYNDALGTFSFTVTGAPPSGTAGGVLTGSYPNPSFAASPAFTGNPTAPTPTTGDNDTSIATTAFVQAATGTLFNATYGTTIATSLANGNLHVITVTNTTGFAISAPTGMLTGQRLTYLVKNTAGAAMGLVTWNAVFKMAGAWTNPATGNARLVSFVYDGANWYELTRSPSDVA